MTSQVVQWQTDPMADQLLTVEQVAEELQVDPSSVRRLIDAGDLPYVNIAPAGATRKTIRVRRTALDRWIDSRDSEAEQ